MSGQDQAKLEQRVARYDFATPVETSAFFRDVVDMLDQWTLHSAHPRYFGLFNPPALPITVPADALVALYNPQVGTWTHAPVANEIERHVLRFLGKRIGMEPCTAHFTSGGQEANTTALNVALAHAFPQVVTQGLCGIDTRPRMYVSEHAHHSLERASRFVGLGSDNVVNVKADLAGALDLNALEAHLAADTSAGCQPFLVVGTAGTTGLGSIDPLRQLADLCAQRGLWFHVDAAWGGSALLSDVLAPQLNGIDQADSVTWDAHKWMSVPMGAGMFFTRHREALQRVYDVHTGYVPASEGAQDEPYMMTAQWSRRFIGLKVFAALASLSADGYAALIERQAAMGERLRSMLRAHGYQIINDTLLPLVCFSHPDANTPEAHAAVAARIESRGNAWISRLVLPSGQSMMRACITSFETNEEDLAILMSELDAAIAAQNGP